MRARLLLAAAALAAFGASLGSGFHFDDYAIFSDPVLKSSRGLLEMWGLRHPGPLTHLTLWLNYQAGGEDPLGYHAVSLLLHLGAALLVYACLRRMLGERAGLIAAALFAVHPLQAEAVNYVSARGVMVGTVLALTALLAWLLGRRWIAMLAGAAAVLDGAYSAHAAAIGPGVHAGSYLLAQGVVMWRFLRLLVVPWGFSIDPDIHVPAVWLGLLGWLAILGVAALAWHWRKTPSGDSELDASRRACHIWLAVGFGLMMIGALRPARDLAADYRMYPAMVAFAAAAGTLLGNIKAREVSIGLTAVLVLVSGFRTYTWMSDERLWREAVSHAPQKARPKLQLARAVRAAEALELLAKARTLDPYNPEIPAETGKVFLAEQQPEAALQEFNAALALEPRNALNLNNRGVALAEMGHTDAARLDFEQALIIDPGFSEARENLSKLGAR